MSNSMSAWAAPNLPDLPAPWLGQLFKQVASGTSGILSIAHLSRTCKGLYAAGDELASSYMKIGKIRIDRPDCSFWRWLAKREGRITSLALTVSPFYPSYGYLLHPVHEQAGWEQPLRLLSAVPSLSLTVEMPSVAQLSRPSIERWLVEHGHLIEQLKETIRPDTPAWAFADLLKAAAACKSLNLTSDSGMWRENPGRVPHDIKGFAGLSGLTQLTALRLYDFDMYEDPWVTLAALTNLRELDCTLFSNDDPSPLTALTKLTCLELCSRSPLKNRERGYFEGFSFSSLQPLSALQQLQKLVLRGKAFSGTSLQGLASLPQLREYEQGGGDLRSLEGLGPGITRLDLSRVPVSSLHGLEVVTALQRLALHDVTAPTLRPLANLSALTDLMITDHCSGFGTPTMDLQELAAFCSSLRDLYLCDCANLQSLSGVEQLCNLKDIYLDYCKVTSLHPLAQVTGLTRLTVYDCECLAEHHLELPQLDEEALDVQRRERERATQGGA